MTPGPWTAHSENVALAERIAEVCPGLDADKACVCGLLHNIGRRMGVAVMRHSMDGCDDAMAQGWNEAACVCLTHAFSVQDIEADMGRKDIMTMQQRFIDGYLKRLTYDLYDKLIIVCDALTDAQNFCILEKRFVDTMRRVGAYPFTVARWNQTYAFQEGLEAQIGCSIHILLPGIRQCISRK